MKNRCLKEFCGEAEDIEESREEASSGMGTSSSGGSSPCARRFRRRCGRTVSSVLEGIGVAVCSDSCEDSGMGCEVEAVVSAGCAAIWVSGFLVSANQLPFQRSLSIKNFLFKTCLCL